jgi:transcriptional regulator with XRE-family HTH domain
MRNNLIKLRKTLGLTQSEFGELFGLSKNQVCWVETNRTKGMPEFWIDLQIKFNLTAIQTKELMEVI